MLLTTLLTPLTFFAILVDLSRRFFSSTISESVATPSFTSTMISPPRISGSAESLIITWSRTAASFSGLSAAAAARSSVSRRVQSFHIVFSGHCTPVQCIEEGSLLAPSRLHAHMKIEIDLHAEDALHLFARERANL